MTVSAHGRGRGKGGPLTAAEVDERYRLATDAGAEPVADAPVAWSGKAAPKYPRPTAWQAAQTGPATDAWPRQGYSATGIARPGGAIARSTR